MFKITHTGEDIDWVNGPDKPGATNTYVEVFEAGESRAKKTWYRMVAGKPELRANWEAIRDAEAQVEADKVTRKDVIIAARATSGLREVTVPQALAYIQGKMDTTALDATGAAIDSATTVAQLRVATKAALIELRKLHKNTEEVFEKMVPYLLD